MAQQVGSAGVAEQIQTPNIVRVGGTLGAEVSGIDLSKPISPAAFGALNAALLDHKVLFFRDQNITPEQHIALGKIFGEVTVHPFVPHLPDHPEVIVLDNHKDNPVLATDHWHSDETFREEPPMGSILHCVRIPEAGGDTLWADMCAVYAGLSDKMQHFLSGLEAVHDFKPFRRNFEKLEPVERYKKLTEMELANPNPTHPVIRTHPVTGEKALYVNEQFTLYIKGMRRRESDALLGFLCGLPNVPEYQFRFRWQPGSIVIWDNRPTQHYAANDYYPARRTMQRITIKGDRPF
jgi:taurine dioxygenase